MLCVCLTLTPTAALSELPPTLPLAHAGGGGSATPASFSGDLKWRNQVTL